MTFGKRLRAAREAASLTQTQLGQGLGTDGADASKSVVMGWEKDKHHPRADQLILICEKLKVSADHLLFGATADYPAIIEEIRSLVRREAPPAAEPSTIDTIESKPVTKPSTNRRKPKVR